MLECSMWYREGRPKWLGPIPYKYPEHLQGEAPGDYGFDILGLACDPVAFNKYFKFVPAPLHAFKVDCFGFAGLG
jgi:hypothetical protein